MPDKLIVSNRDALTQEYGQNGLVLIEKAIARLIAADQARGITTELTYIDDAKHMSNVGGQPVLGPQDEKGAKDAVDAIFKHHDPAYLVLLDGPAIVPHIQLDNPLPQDGDLNVPTDLPYASNVPFSRRISDFVSVTRVVSRLPGLPGSKDARFLTKLMDRRRSHRPRSAKSYEDFFAISADIWKTSTRMSLSQVFGSHTALKLSPTQSHPAIDTDLSKLAHFINCHGAMLRPEFYGEKDRNKPIAMESEKITGRIKNGTVVTAECCYGALLYDSNLAGRDKAMCVSYLENGAIGFVGSTNISYGPANSNGGADLLAQYFWIEVRKGASIGRAFIQARQNFVLRERMSDPVNLKTLGQFVLLGDASIHPCIARERAVREGAPSEVDTTIQRKATRLLLASRGESLASSASAVTDLVREDSAVAGHESLITRVRDLAMQRGLVNPHVASYKVGGGDAFMQSVKNMDAIPLVTVATDVRKSSEKALKATGADADYPVPEIRVLVAHSLSDRGDHGIAFLRDYESH